MSALASIPTSTRSWLDETTGRRIRQLTSGKPGSGLGYFRYPRHLPDGRTLARLEGNYTLLDARTGEFEPLSNLVGGYLKFRTRDGRLWTTDKNRQVWETQLPRGESTLLGRIPDHVVGSIADITCDGRTVILLDMRNYQVDGYPLPTTKDPAVFWRYITRPRRGSMSAYDLVTGKSTLLVDTQGKCPFHTDTHPTDPGLVRFAFDEWEGYNQRVWSIRTDGSDLRKIRPQARGELITHEFWWSDAKHIGFTYQDRRLDDQHEALPWCEYAPAPTRLGIADLAGNQVYLSDPVNHYHTHLFCSFNGQFLSGSGTDGHSFVYAARFSFDNPKINYVPLATIHTPYIPFRGQEVNCDISADGRWMVYSDTIDGAIQLCAVEVDV